MAETSTIFGFMKYVSATDILSDFKKTVDSHFVNSLNSSLIATVISFRSIRILDFPSQSFVHVPNKISIPIQALNL